MSCFADAAVTITKGSFSWDTEDEVPTINKYVDFLIYVDIFRLHYKRQGPMRGLAIFTQDNQEPLVVKEKVGRPLDEHGVNKSVECDTFSPSVFSQIGRASGRASVL